MSDLDVADLARTLEKTAAHLKQHIATEAQKRAAELGKTYAKAADERIRDNAADLQRAQDLVAELRRQMKPLERISEKYGRIVSLARTAGWERRDSVSAEVLLDIINGRVEG